MNKKPQLNVQLEHHEKELFDRIEANFGVDSKTIVRSLLRQFLVAYEKKPEDLVLGVKQMATVLGETKEQADEPAQAPTAVKPVAKPHKGTGYPGVVHPAQSSKRKVS